MPVARRPVATLSGRTAAVVRAPPRRRAWRRVLNPHRAACSVLLLSLALAIAPVAAGATGATTPAAPAEGPSATDSARWIRDTLLAAGYPGARLLVARGDTVLVDIAAGHADVARSKPLRQDAIYRIHSMTKPIVS